MEQYLNVAFIDTHTYSGAHFLVIAHALLNKTARTWWMQKKSLIYILTNNL